MKHLFILLPLLFAPAPTQSYSVEVGFPFHGPWLWDQYLPVFDTSLGTLVQVDVSINMELQRTLGLEMLDRNGWGYAIANWYTPWTPPSADQIGQPGPGYWDMTARVPGTTSWPTVLMYERVAFVRAACPFDGVIDHEGPSGARMRTFSPEEGTEQSYTDPAVLAAFQGPGSIVKVMVQTTETIQLYGVTGGGVTTMPSIPAYTDNKGRIVVRYTYQ